MLCVRLFVVVSWFLFVACCYVLDVRGLLIDVLLLFVGYCLLLLVSWFLFLASCFLLCVVRCFWFLSSDSCFPRFCLCLFLVAGLLFHVDCSSPLFILVCLLFIVRCLLFVVRCSLLVVCCVLFVFV